MRERDIYIYIYRERETLTQAWRLRDAEGLEVLRDPGTLLRSRSPVVEQCRGLEMRRSRGLGSQRDLDTGLV